MRNHWQEYSNHEKMFGKQQLTFGESIGKDQSQLSHIDQGYYLGSQKSHTSLLTHNVSSTTAISPPAPGECSMIEIWLDCLVYFCFSRDLYLPCLYHVCLLFVPRPVRSCVILTEIIKEKRINIPVFVYGVLFVLSMLVFGVESALFYTLFGISCGIAGYFCAPRIPKDEVKLMAYILSHLEHILHVQESRNCSRLNELLSELHDGVEVGLQASWQYHSFLEERSSIIESFHLIDLNNDGQISPDEIRQFLSTRNGYFLLKFISGESNVIYSPEDAVKLIFKEYDSDGDAMISTNEFIYLMMSRQLLNRQ